jgi:opacity protein-like surface antigen
MKTIICPIVMIGAALMMSAASACAADWTDNLYLNADAGAAFQQNASLVQNGVAQNATFNPGLRADITLGYDINDSWAAELETGIIWNSIDQVGGISLGSIDQSVDIYSVPILANIVFKVPTKTPWSPYLGVGAGGVVSTFSFESAGTSYSDTGLTFAYQAKAGLDYALSKNASIGIAYKFLGTFNPRWFLSDAGDHVKLDGVYIHAVVASFTWKF